MRSEGWGITVRADERGPPKIMVWVSRIHEGVVRGQVVGRGGRVRAGLNMYTGPVVIQHGYRG